MRACAGNVRTAGYPGGAVGGRSSSSHLLLSRADLQLRRAACCQEGAALVKLSHCKQHRVHTVATVPFNHSKADIAHSHHTAKLVGVCARHKIIQLQPDILVDTASRIIRQGL